MRRVPFNPSALAGDQRTWWEDWWERARKAIEDAKDDIGRGRQHAFRSPVWKELKDWLLTHVFEGKCAYCEGPILAGFYGDAEHYRPKGKVTHRGAIISVNGSPHPGYYWIAYHWKNLIPSCQRCNSEAKGTEFEAAAYSTDNTLDPDKLDAVEKPLLLHPYGVGHDEALVFGEFGKVSARSGDPRGAATIRTCGLDREVLDTARQQEQRIGWAQFMHMMHREQSAAFAEWLRKRPYSAAVLAYVQIKYEESRPTL